jgi:hypothetical protein
MFGYERRRTRTARSVNGYCAQSSASQDRLVAAVDHARHDQPIDDWKLNACVYQRQWVHAVDLERFLIEADTDLPHQGGPDTRSFWWISAGYDGRTQHAGPEQH